MKKELLDETKLELFRKSFLEDCSYIKCSLWAEKKQINLQRILREKICQKKWDFVRIGLQFFWSNN